MGVSVAAYHDVTQEAATEMALDRVDNDLTMSLKDHGEVAVDLNLRLRHDGSIVVQS